MTDRQRDPEIDRLQHDNDVLEVMLRSSGMSRFRRFARTAGTLQVVQFVVVVTLIAVGVVRIGVKDPSLLPYVFAFFGVPALMAFLMRNWLVRHYRFTRWMLNTISYVAIVIFVLNITGAPLPWFALLAFVCLTGYLLSATFWTLSDPLIIRSTRG